MGRQAKLITLDVLLFMCRLGLCYDNFCGALCRGKFVAVRLIDCLWAPLYRGDIRA